MTHELLWNVLGAQKANSVLSGVMLRRAAEDLVAIRRDLGAVVQAFDGAGERLIGAALLLDDESFETRDATTTLPDGSVCLLVGGYLAGTVGVEMAIKMVKAAGAGPVHVALLGGHAGPLDGVVSTHQMAARANMLVA